jgi:predicted unusual protein kinase regulating ubiquinone biosynthesis (AarF/ABC1/UbiB family)
MFDAADPIPLEAVRQVVHEELGMWPEEIFAEFDPNPIGSAVSQLLDFLEWRAHLSV